MRVFLHTFGCKANQYDTEVVRQSIEQNGGVVVNSMDEADAVVVNSCTVTQSGEAKLRNLVRRAVKQPNRPNAVVIGCAAAVDDGTIAKIPGVGSVVGGAEPGQVLKALGLDLAEGSSSILNKFSGSARAWLKIQDGCDEHCTFCATVLARGANRSRDPEIVLDEARKLAEHHEELVLTGVHVGSYGVDLERGWSLSRLVEYLVKNLPNVRFRLSSVEATEVDELLADLMADVPGSLAPHLHAPLQSGSDKILKRMGRHWYNSASYRARIERLAERLPVFGLGADVMVGFPGETRADFQETVRLVHELPFTYLHVFPYSERPNTAAPRLGAAVGTQELRERAAELRELATAKGEEHRKKRIGDKADVVVLDRRAGVWRGITEDYLDVVVSLSEIVPRRLVGVMANQADGSLMAQPIGEV